MTTALRSEAMLLRRRPMPYVTGAVWVLLVVAFAFLVPYIVYVNLDAAEPGRDALLAILLPPSVHHTALGSYPMFGGAIMLILGVLVTGSEFGWGSWKVRFTQGPSRTEVMLAKFGVAATAAVLIALVALGAAALASVGVAALAGQDVTGWPTPAQLATSAAVAAVIAVVYTFVGMALSVVFRGTTVAIAVGLVWTLGLENAVAGVASMIPALEPLRWVLLSSASGSLVASTGVATQAEVGTPGVVDVLSGPVALAVLAAYAVAAVVLSTALMRRRDVP